MRSSITGGRNWVQSAIIRVNRIWHVTKSQASRMHKMQWRDVPATLGPGVVLPLSRIFAFPITRPRLKTRKLRNMISRIEFHSNKRNIQNVFEVSKSRSPLVLVSAVAFIPLHFLWNALYSAINQNAGSIGPHETSGASFCLRRRIIGHHLNGNSNVVATRKFVTFPPGGRREARRGK